MALVDFTSRSTHTAAMVKVRMMCYLDPAQAEALKKISAETRLGVSLLVRDAVDMLIKDYQKRKKLRG